jgi:sulfiredoxin
MMSQTLCSMVTPSVFHSSRPTCYPLPMLKRETIAIADVYVPVKRRATLEQKRVDEIAASMLDIGQQAPILVRADGARYVLVEGLHRLEAAKALGEKTIVSFLVDARRH